MPTSVCAFTRTLRAATVLVALISVSSVFAAFSPNAGEATFWSFPYPERPKNYSGIVVFDSSDASTTMLPHKGITLTWAALNPYENQYNFKDIADALDAADAGNYGVIFRLKCSRYGGATERGHLGVAQNKFVPDWVVTNHNLQSFTFETKSNVIYLAPWHPDLQDEFQKFLREFKKHDFLKRNSFLGIYVHGFSSSSGEEMAVEANGYPSSNFNTAAQAFFPDAGAAVNDFLMKRLDWWKDVAGEYDYKVAFVGAGKINNINNATYLNDDINAHALSLGFGLRYGNLEHYFYEKVQPGKHGQEYPDDGKGYVTDVWTQAGTPTPIRDGRYWGDENEETVEYHYAGTDNIWDTSDDTQYPDGAYPLGQHNPRELAFRSSFFRAAQLGMGFLWTSKKAINSAGNVDGSITADTSDYLPNWFRLTAGKRPLDAPDAVVWLREAYLRQMPKSTGGDWGATLKPWKNIGRMLYQVDTGENHSSVPALFRDANCTNANRAISKTEFLVDMPYVSIKVKYHATNYPNANSPTANPNVSDNEWTARSTDIAGSSYSMAFKLDDEFVSSANLTDGQDVEVRVHFWNNPAKVSPFRIRVAKGGTTTWDTDICNDTSGVAGWKTAIFQVPYSTGIFTPGSRLGTGVHFSLRATDATGGTAVNDVIVRWVRVVRKTPIKKAPRIEMMPVTVTAHVDDPYDPATRTPRAIISVHAEGPIEKDYGTNTTATDLNYVWQKYIASNWVNVSTSSPFDSRYSGFTNKATLTIANPVLGDGGQYRVRVRNRIRGVDHETISDPADLIVKCVVDDFEDGNRTLPNPAGTWSQDTQPHPNPPATYAAQTFTVDSTNPSPDGYYYLRAGFSGDAAAWKYVILAPGTTYLGAKWTAKGAGKIQFRLKGSATVPSGKIFFQMREGLTGERWNFDLSSAIATSVSTSNWVLVTIPFTVSGSSFVLDTSGGSSVPPSVAGQLDLALIDQIRLFSKSYPTAVNVMIDAIEVIK